MKKAANNNVKNQPQNNQFKKPDPMQRPQVNKNEPLNNNQQASKPKPP